MYPQLLSLFQLRHRIRKNQPLFLPFPLSKSGKLSLMLNQMEPGSQKQSQKLCLSQSLVTLCTALKVHPTKPTKTKLLLYMNLLTPNYFKSTSPFYLSIPTFPPKPLCQLLASVPTTIRLQPRLFTPPTLSTNVFNIVFNQMLLVVMLSRTTPQPIPPSWHKMAVTFPKFFTSYVT